MVGIRREHGEDFEIIGIRQTLVSRVSTMTFTFGYPRIIDQEQALKITNGTLGQRIFTMFKVFNQDNSHKDTGVGMKICWSMLSFWPVRSVQSLPLPG